MNEKNFKEKFEELSRDGKELVRILKKKKSYGGFMRLLTDLYPDKAHFIFELLQNAQDAKATSVQFRLLEDRLEFEHNGTKQFDIADIEAITSIGYDDSTKKDDPTTIGKFGVGFKAVFLYTNAPEIYSGNIRFKIEELFVPIWIESSISLESSQTLFVFNFTHSKKPKQDAYRQIESGLSNLNSTSLLFLTNISKIRIEKNSHLQRTLERKELGNNRVDIIGEIENSNWLVFQKELALIVKEKQESEHEVREITKEKLFIISAAFGFDSKANKVIPVKGEVCVYFPCESITSNLKFHINAPFSSTVARDSIIGCKENSTMLDAIGELVADSLVWIRDNNLLTTDFIAVIPNSKDSLGDFYKPIWEKIIAKFKSEELVPMQIDGHHKALNLFRGDDEIRELFSDEQLAALLNTKENKYKSPIWAENAKGVAEFYTDLGIKFWTITNAISLLKEGSCKEFLCKQTLQWHRKLYAYLDKKVIKENSILYLKNENGTNTQVISMPLVRLKDGSYATGQNLFFQKKDIAFDETYSLVEMATYSFRVGNEKEEDEAKSSMSFLQKTGVKPIGKKQEIEILLKQNYNQNSNRQDINDIIFFIEFFENNKEEAKKILLDYPIFKTSNSNNWVKGDQIYLDNPYLKTELRAFYCKLNHKAFTLSEDYLGVMVNKEKLKSLVVALNGKTTLQIDHKSCKNNLNWKTINKYENEGATKIDNDYTIRGLEGILGNREIDLPLSKLIWCTLNSIPNYQYYYFTAEYRANQQRELRTLNSTLVNVLKMNEWVPQEIDNLIKFVRPFFAIADYLPKDFDCDIRKEWLNKIEFGGNEQKRKNLEKEKDSQTEDERNAEERVFKKYGISQTVLERAKKLEDEGISVSEFDNFINSRKRQSVMFNQKEIKDSELREKKISTRIHSAPNKVTELRTRSVSVSDNQIDPQQYLQELYTTDNKMGCQLCSLEMPFKKRNGKYYFEAVEVLTSNFFTKEFEAQHLALCPECAARYQEYVKKDTNKMEVLKEELLQEYNNPIPVTLDNKSFKLLFVATHRFDLRIALQEAGKLQ